MAHSKAISNTRCILCSKSTSKLLIKINRVKIYECQNCGLGITSEVRSAKSALYTSDKFYSSDSFQKRIDIMLWKFERVLSAVKLFVSKGAVLDVGAGYGLLSRILATDQKYQVTAIEPNLKPHYIERASKVVILRKSFQRIKFGTKKFSAVFFMDVLEHFSDPLAILEKTRGILRKNGYVVVLLPNYQSFMRKVAKNWAWWMIEDHHYHYSRKSLKMLLAKSNFEVVYLDSFEHSSDMWLHITGRYSRVHPKLLRWLWKVIFGVPQYLSYLLLRPFLWKTYQGGLLFVIAKKQ